jgi:subtilisin family serine protease
LRDVGAGGVRRRLRSVRTILAVVLVAGGTLARPVPAQAQPSPTGTGQVIPAPAGTAIAGSYLVAFSDRAVARSQVGAVANELTNRLGGRVGRVYTAALGGFHLIAPPAVARQIAADPRVEIVEQDARTTVSDGPPPRPPSGQNEPGPGPGTTAGVQHDPQSWGLDRIDQRRLPLDQLYRYPTTAASVTAYIVDTGINATHKDFGGRAVAGFDFFDNVPVGVDCDGHGTHVAGTVGGSVSGVAKAVHLVSLKVFGCEENGNVTGSDEAVVAAVDWITGHGVRPAVVNMSLGGHGEVPVLHLAVAASVAAGFTYVVAAGNESRDACGFSPAAYPEVIDVAATDRTDAFAADYSNFGPCVALLAPGTDVVSSFFGNDASLVTETGTSMASPHVAGVAALILAFNPGYRPAQVRACLLADATRGVLRGVPPGTPDLLLHVAQDYRGCAGLAETGTLGSVPWLAGAGTVAVLVGLVLVIAGRLRRPVGRRPLGA